MKDRPKSWIVKLPERARSAVTHRFSIAGRSSEHAKRSIDPPHGPQASGMVSERMRHAMVARIAERGVDDAVVLDAMRAIPRHAFVDPGLASRAYEDTALPIGSGQTISQPYIVAYMISLMRAGKPLSRVLEVGTGCGYQAAVLGRCAQLVVSIERIRALHELARNNLRPLRMASVRLHYGDGRIGLAAEGPYDGIIIAAAGLGVSDDLLKQLRVGARLVAPLAAQDGSQHLVVIDRIDEHRWQQRDLDHVNFVPLRSGTS